MPTIELNFPEYPAMPEYVRSLKILLKGPHNAQKTVKIQRVVKGGIPHSQQPTVIMLPNRQQMASS